ncbi:MAG: KpsF/GutQ family sugar-phosphate isomerase [Bacteroidetes bacterium]|nr:KpsF/GutQ family sugar-phosphate isomerase [Bacteroidota bacterium]
MKKFREIKQNAIKTLQVEANSVKNLVDFIDNSFAEAILAILKFKGRLIITGIGKSAIICNKIVSTLNSTGTPAVFMHAADAIHGDLGMIQSEDIVICISKSGETPEIKNLVPLLKKGGNLLIGMVGNTKSFLASQSDYIINCSVDEEACPNNLAPTSSTTAQLAMGDAIAVCLLKARNFSSADFAKYHPGGALGKKLYLTLKDFTFTNLKPQVFEDDSIKTAIFEITKARLGATAVIDKKNNILGIITDGDIRRMLDKYDQINNLKAKDIMSRNPFSLESGCMAIEAVTVMSDKKITQILVTEKSKYCGIVHIHDLNKEGIY